MKIVIVFKADPSLNDEATAGFELNRFEFYWGS